MIHLTLITVGTLKEGYLKDAEREYEKRLSQYARVEEINIKEERIADEDDSAQIARALSAEGDKILDRIPQGAYRIALCVEGREFDSVTLAREIERAAERCGKICLIIGSSHGLSDKVKSACDLRLSVSRLTFPHQLMRVILAEVLYRSFTIIAGKKYHK
ncbi:MAG: 23S rRNA (pseudouridine(1915)-N(3))-methyltransferase RlmH [Clostridia bacterium]|nr:23S rRNA (pseudouridine(1915)-N(3))-methyltransferase RlmH [Clostridia bacterium]MBQ8720283.1 23S rRNA (pseudouridine(1915)-N(3))-methyltransferase RlmH [Clostridia bacterium]